MHAVAAEFIRSLLIIFSVVKHIQDDITARGVRAWIACLLLKIYHTNAEINTPVFVLVLSCIHLRVHIYPNDVFCRVLSLFVENLW